MGRPALPVEVQRLFWSIIRDGEILDDAARLAGVSKSVALRWFREAGGVMPDAVPLAARTTTRLSFTEREEIGCRSAAGEGVRAIARVLGRSPSTISRELARGTVRRKTGYRASVAQAGADTRARRPKAALLARQGRLREHVQGQLLAKYSPEQISRRLVVDFLDDPEMRVSHETIYQALYVQGRGALRRELTTCLRTGRALRKPRRKSAKRRGRIAGMVNISQRPAEVEDRAVPGHWEGDLITGSVNKSAIGTLVERATGYVMLLHLPVAHGAPDVQDAMVEVMSSLPDTLRRTPDMGPGTGDVQPHPDRRGHRARHLLLRSPLALAARHQRKHQRPAAPVLPERHRSVGLPPRLPLLRRRRAQPPPAQTTRLAQPRRSPRPATVPPARSAQRCVDRLNPPGLQVPQVSSGG
jgi:transposase, IS30 family